MPVFNTGLSALGNDDTWTPVWRDERSYTVSTNLTKVAGRHEIRSGFDFVRLRLNHWQPEVSNPRGDAHVRRRRHRHPRLCRRRRLERLRRVPARPDEQLRQERPVRGTERPRKPVRPVRGRSLAGQREAHGEPRPALRVLPVDDPRRTAASSCSTSTRSTSGSAASAATRRIWASTSARRSSRRASAPPTVSTSDTVFRAGYGKTFTPLPWSRPMRGRFPLTIAYSDAGPNGFIPYGNVANGIPRRAEPGPLERQRPAAARRGHDVPRSGRYRRGAPRSRGTCSSSAACRWTSPSASATSARAPTASYASRNLNYAESGGNANRSCSPPGRHRRHQRARLLGAVALPLAAGGREPSVQERAPAQGRLHVEQGHERGRRRRRAAIRGPSRRSSTATTRWPATTVRTCCRWASCTSCPSRGTARNPVALVIKDWQINGIASWLSGTPFTIGGDNGLLQQQGGSQTINVTGDPEPGFGEAGPDEQWYDPAAVLAAGQRLGQQRTQPRSADRRTGTSTSRCSGRSRSVTTGWRSAPSRRTCSTTRSGATR